MQKRRKCDKGTTPNSAKAMKSHNVPPPSDVSSVMVTSVQVTSISEKDNDATVDEEDDDDSLLLLDPPSQPLMNPIVCQMPVDIAPPMATIQTINGQQSSGPISQMTQSQHAMSWPQANQLLHLAAYYCQNPNNNY